MDNKLIAVYGNSGAYKTVTSVRLACALKNHFPTADVAIVGLDHTKPILPTLFPSEAPGKASIGKILSSSSLDQEVILSNMFIQGDFSIIGYNARENMNTYAAPAEFMIDDFFVQLRHLVNYTIIDCTSDVRLNKLTSKALINADEVVELLSADINGMVFDVSQESLLQSEQYRYRRFIRCVTEPSKAIPAVAEAASALTRISLSIPYSSSVAEAFYQGKTFNNFFDKKYNKVINELAKRVSKEDKYGEY